MGIAELKEQLHQKIDSADDLSLLGVINDLLSRNEGVFEVPEKFIPGIKKGMRDYRNGDFITMEEFEAKYQQWLKD